MWGFGADQLNNGPDAAIVNSDWTLNAAGIRFQERMDRWEMHGDFSLDPDGAIQLRAFHGDYRATVIHDGQQVRILVRTC